MKKRFSYVKLSNKEGSALLMSIVVFLVIVIVLMGSSMVALANLNMSKASSDYTSVYYVAETGVDKYVEDLKKFVTSNATQVSANPSQLSTLFATHHNGSNGVISYDFGLLMNETANASVAMTFISNQNGEFFFNVISKGTLGGVSRSITLDLKLNVEIKQAEGETIIGIESPAIISLDLSVSRDYESLKFEGRVEKLLGPYISPNSAVKRNSGSQSWFGPFIFGGNLTDKGSLTTHNPLIIYGDYILDGWNSNIAIMVFVNNDSKIHFETNGGVIENLFVPTNYDIRNIVLQSNNSTDSTTHALRIKDRVKNIVRFDPKNFDPYTSVGYTANKPSSEIINTLFGEKGSYPYNNYFAESFFMNHLDDPIATSQILPDYKFPDAPVIGSIEYPWVNTTQTSSLSSNVKISNDLIEFDKSDGVLVLKNNISVKRIEASKWLKGTIEIGDRDIEIVTEAIDINNITLEVIGTGTLTFHVVGNNGIVEVFEFAPHILKSRNSYQATTLNDIPSNFRMIVGKTDKGSGPINWKTSNTSHERMSMVVLSEDLNAELVNDFHGVFVSLKGTSFYLSINSSSAQFTGVMYMPQASAKISNNYAGSFVSKYFNVENAGIEKSEYVGSMNDAMISDIMGFLEYDTPGSNIGGNPGSGGNVGQDETILTVETLSQREIGD